MELRIEMLIEILKEKAKEHPGAAIGIINTLDEDEKVCDIEGIYFSKHHNRIILDIENESKEE